MSTTRPARDAAPRFGTLHPGPAAAPTNGTLSPANGSAKMGYCRHKIFGRGKIIATLDGGKVRVNFPDFGPKVILADYLEMEDAS